MNYYIGLLILLVGIFDMTDLAIKTRNTRKRLKNIKYDINLIKVIKDLMN